MSCWAGRFPQCYPRGFFHFFFFFFRRFSPEDFPAPFDFPGRTFFISLATALPVFLLSRGISPFGPFSTRRLSGALPSDGLFFEIFRVFRHGLPASKPFPAFLVSRSAIVWVLDNWLKTFSRFISPVSRFFFSTFLVKVYCVSFGLYTHFENCSADSFESFGLIS